MSEQVDGGTPDGRSGDPAWWAGLHPDALADEVVVTARRERRVLGVGLVGLLVTALVLVLVATVGRGVGA